MPEDLLRLARICRDQAANCADSHLAEVLHNMAVDYERRAAAKSSSSPSHSVKPRQGRLCDEPRPSGGQDLSITSSVRPSSVAGFDTDSTPATADQSRGLGD